MSKRKPIPPKLRFRILARDNFTCQYCGNRPSHSKLQVDHIIPVSKGGVNEEWNYVTSCTVCNIGKGDNLLQDLLGFNMDIRDGLFDVARKHIPCITNVLFIYAFEQFKSCGTVNSEILAIIQSGLSLEDFLYRAECYRTGEFW